MSAVDFTSNDLFYRLGNYVPNSNVLADCESFVNFSKIYSVFGNVTNNPSSCNGSDFQIFDNLYFLDNYNLKNTYINMWYNLGISDFRNSAVNVRFGLPEKSESLSLKSPFSSVFNLVSFKHNKYVRILESQCFNHFIWLSGYVYPTTLFTDDNLFYFEKFRFTISAYDSSDDVYEVLKPNNFDEFDLDSYFGDLRHIPFSLVLKFLREYGKKFAVYNANGMIVVYEIGQCVCDELESLNNILLEIL